MRFSSSLKRPQSWSEMKLADVCKTFTSGGTPSRKRPDFYVNGSIPWVKTKELNDGVVTEVEEFITTDALKNSSAKLLPRNTVLLAMYGATVGKLGVLGIEAACNQACAAMVPKDGVVDFRFLYYLLMRHREEIIGQATGGAQQNLSGELIKGFTFDFPTFQEQQAIANSLWLLDEKISANRAVSKTLEEIAQTVFKSWFIDFDPVKAKMAGEKPGGMDDATAALFPDSMEDSELGLIPADWHVGTVSQICSTLVNGSTPLRSNTDFWNSPDVTWFKTGELSDGFLLASKELISESALKGSSVKVLPKGSVLMAIYAAPTVGRLGILTHDSTFNQACTGMLARAEFGLPYLFLQLKYRRVWFNSFAIGAAQQNISKSIVEQCPVVIAPNSVHIAFLEIVGPLFAEIEGLTAQSAQLVALRDALLPRLISGELQIPEEMLVS